MKKWAWLLALCLALTAFFPAALAEEASGDFTVKVSVPEDFEGELNGRLLFMFDYEMPE